MLQKNNRQVNAEFVQGKKYVHLKMKMTLNLDSESDVLFL